MIARGVCLSSLLLTACGPSKATQERDALRSEVLVTFAEHLMLPHYEEAARQAGYVGVYAAQGCPSDDTTAADGDRFAWDAAREAYKQAEIVQFGPVVEYPERLGPKLDDWPVNEDAVEELVAGDLALEFSGFGSAIRGFPVVEYLLWAPTAEAATQALSADPRRCQVFAGAAGDVKDNLDLLVQVWRDDWIPQLTTPAEDGSGAYATQQEVLDEWVNRMAFTAENLRATRLGKPVGDSSGGEPQPDTLESAHSGRSLADARAALTGIAEVWRGDGEDHPGLSALVATYEGTDDLRTLIDAALVQAALRLDDIPEPLSQAIYDTPELIARAQEPLQELQVLIQVDLAQVLGVTITFNDNDGD